MALTFEVSEVVAASPQRVFQAMTDLESAQDWAPDLVKIELLTEGDFGLGTRWNETRRPHGREATEQFEVSAFEPPWAFRLRVDGTKGTSGQGEYLFDYELMQDGPRTQVTVRGEIRQLGRLLTVVGKLFLGPFKRSVGRDLTALKRYVEGRAASAE